MTVTSAEVPRIAAQIRTAGELWEVHGALMLKLTDEWAAGAKTANLDPESRSNRWERDPDTGEVVPVPSDPTGEGMLRARAEMRDELRRRVARMVEDALWLRDAAHVLAPIVLPSTMNQRDDLWCSHHLRIGLCEPRSRNDLCRWCSDFFSLWKIRPPVSLLAARHEGKRVTERMIRDALDADGVILQTVGGVTKAVRKARGSTGRPNQNRKKGRAAS